MEARRQRAKSNVNMDELSALSLGNSQFKKDYNIKFAYLSGGMYRGIASTEMVVKMGKAGMLIFFGSGGLELSEIKNAIECWHNRHVDEIAGEIMVEAAELLNERLKSIVS